MNTEPQQYRENLVSRVREAVKRIGYDHLADKIASQHIGGEQSDDGLYRWELRITATWGDVPLSGTITEYWYAPQFPGRVYPRRLVAFESAAYTA